MTKLYLTSYARQKLRYFVDLCEDEISGFGKLEVKVENGERYLIVTDFIIIKQVCSGAHSTMDEESMGKFLYEITKSGEDLSKWKVWWHSHAKMTAFFSGTDTGTIDKSTEFPYLVSLVSNHNGDIIARLDIFDPLRHHETLEVVVLSEENEELKALCQKEIDEKVSKSPERTYPQMGYHSGKSYHQELAPMEGSKRFRKLKKKIGCLTRGDEGYDFDSAEWDTQLGQFVNYLPPKPPISTSNDKETSIIPVKTRPSSHASGLETSDHKHVLDLDDLD